MTELAARVLASAVADAMDEVDVHSDVDAEGFPYHAMGFSCPSAEGEARVYGPDCVRIGLAMPDGTVAAHEFRTPESAALALRLIADGSPKLVSTVPPGWSAPAAMGRLATLSTAIRYKAMLETLDPGAVGIVRSAVGDEGWAVLERVLAALGKAGLGLDATAPLVSSCQHN